MRSWLPISIFFLSLLLDAYCEAWLTGHGYQSLTVQHKASESSSTRLFLDGNKNSAVRAARTRIPYVETYDEQRLRRLFHDPFAFSTAHSIVNQVITESSKSSPHPLGRPPNSNGTQTSGYEQLFDPLYNGKFHDEGSSKRQEISSIDHLSPRQKRLHFCIEVAYNGDDFCGWQRQPNHSNTIPAVASVQQTLEDWIKSYPFVRDTGEGVNLRVCGRTDSGVHAIGQVCRFRTRLPIDEADLQKHLQQQGTDNKSLRVLSVHRTSLDFHPTNKCSCRAYAYILDCKEEHLSREHILLIDAMLRQLAGKELNYFGLSYGRLNSKRSDAKCTLLHARSHYHAEDQQGICIIELVGNRFLRRMVRILVATSVKLALQGHASPGALLDLIAQQDRTLAPKAAPSDGLIFVRAAFDEM